MKARDIGAGGRNYQSREPLLVIPAKAGIQLGFSALECRKTFGGHRMGSAPQTSYRDTPLWQALAAMRIEREGASATFARRLGRKQGWGKRHTYAVIEEYRRFLYLAATGDRPVTPSDDVDEAWHLHLTYTRHYWDELCARILGRPLHHDPTEGGAAQQAHFKDQYAATLARYELVFGEPPRADVWPAPGAESRRLRRWPRLFG